MKIGIVTCGDYWNYGNRLQNFALKYVLEKQFSVATISIIGKQNKIGKNKLLSLKGYFRKLSPMKKQRLMHRRGLKFLDFSKKFLNEAHYDDTFDGIIVGSDQVWNTTWLSEEDFEYFLLKPFSIPKISYAASIGIKSLSSENQKIMGNELKKFQSISVRESDAVRQVEAYSGLQSQLVLDPTLLLTANEWLEALNIHSVGDEKKVVTYFLGPKSEKMIALINQLANEQYKIVSFTDTSKSQIKNLSSSPIEFVEEIASSSIVLTDSYHAIAFSTIFRKPFMIDQRNGEVDMSSRLVSLFELLHLPDRWLNNFENMSNIFEIDYSEYDNVLRLEKEKSINYLKRSLQEIKEPLKHD